MTATPDIRAMHPFRVPMRLRFRGVTERRGVLVRGSAGWGEFSPFPDYGPDYAARWLDAAFEAATVGFPPPVRTSIPVNTTVPAVDAVTAADLVRHSGCSTAKVKVAEAGQDLAADVERVAAVRDVLGPAGRIRVDANGAWDVETAVLALARLARYDLEYVEQPCVTLSELAEVRRRVSIPVAADESIRTADDPIVAARAGAIDLVVVKTQPLGGVLRALEVVEAAGVPAVVSSALETSVGLAAGLALAACLPDLPYACGLGTASMLAGDVVDDPLLPEGGSIVLRRPEPTAALLDQHALGPEEATMQLERMAAAQRARVVP